MNIQVNKITKTYGSGESRVEALHSASLTIRPGDFISIMGPSGSGKSTLLHIISGLDTPTTGSVLYGDTDIHHGSDRELSAFRRQRIGFIFQRFNLLPVLTARENIIMPLLLDKAEKLHPTKYIFVSKCIDSIIHFFYTGNLPLKKMIQQDKSHTLYFELSAFIKDLLLKMDKIYGSILSNRLDLRISAIFYSGAFSSMVYFSILDDVEISEKALEKSIRIMVFPAIE